MYNTYMNTDTNRTRFSVELYWRILMNQEIYSSVHYVRQERCAPIIEIINTAYALGRNANAYIHMYTPRVPMM